MLEILAFKVTEVQNNIALPPRRQPPHHLDA